MNQYELSKKTNSYHHKPYNSTEISNVINDPFVKLAPDVYELTEALLRTAGLNKKSSRILGVIISSCYSYKTGKRVDPKIGPTVSILYNLGYCLNRIL
jgi:hypothetical protein